MATDDSGQNDPSSPPVPRDGEQRRDALGLPQGDEPELDACGVPVQDRPVKGGATLVITGTLICAIVPAVLAIVEGIYHDVPHTLVLIGVTMGVLSGGVWGFTERWHEKIHKKIQLGVAGQRIVACAALVGMISAFALIGISDPNGLSGLSG